MENQNQPVCQSCGMPLTEAEHFGTNADGTKNGEYCVYCFKEGAFTSDETMEQMIEHNLQYLDEFNAVGGTKFTPETAREEMRKFFPQLKRWQA
jgi:hypothetical protein